MDNDSFNQLTLSAGIPWRMVTVLRAYCRYLLQTGLPFSQGYIAQVLENNAPISRLLADLFTARFDPQLPLRAKSLARLGRDILSALEEVTRSTRIEFCGPCGMRCPPRSAPTPSNLSLGSAQGVFVLQDREPAAARVALPKPLFEIFVFSPRMEGVHLRMVMSPAAAFVGRTGAKISVPKYWD